MLDLRRDWGIDIAECLGQHTRAPQRYVRELWKLESDGRIAHVRQHASLNYHAAWVPTPSDESSDSSYADEPYTQDEVKIGAGKKDKYDED